MAKRFTDSEKWNDPWFRRLSPELKCFWFFVLDRCDASGVWKVDMELAGFNIGKPLTEEEVLKAMPGRFEKLTGGRWYVTKFILFQYGELNSECRPHAAILRALKEHGLLDGYLKGINTIKDKDKDQDKEKDQGDARGKTREKKIPESPAAIRITKLYGRKLTKPWVDKEIAAFKKIGKIDLAELELVCQYTEAERKKPEGIHRRELFTFLNNYPGELDRANEWAKRKHVGNGQRKPTSEPEGFRIFIAEHYPDRAETPWDGIPESVRAEFRYADQ